MPFGVCIVVAIVSFILGSRTHERSAQAEKDDFLRQATRREKQIHDAAIEIEKENGLWRLKLFEDLEAKAQDNKGLADSFEARMQPHLENRHRGKAEAYRDVLLTFRGWL
jgi:hypothetical protein